MKTIDEGHFTDSLFTLIKETFEGPPAGKSSAYLDQNCGLFQTLDGLSAEDASRAVAPGGATVAGHCEHVRFYLDVLMRYMQGRMGKVDWKESWLVSAVDAARWDELRDELRRAYALLDTSLRSAEQWGERGVGGAMAILAHTAYHLGAVRQILRARGEGA